MTTLGEFLREEMDGLAQLRDELRVQAELASMDLRDTWRGLEKRYHELEGKVKVVRKGAEGDVEEIREAAELLAQEVRQGYEHMKSRL